MVKQKASKQHRQRCWLLHVEKDKQSIKRYLFLFLTPKSACRHEEQLSIEGVSPILSKTQYPQDETPYPLGSRPRWIAPLHSFKSSLMVGWLHAPWKMCHRPDDTSSLFLAMPLPIFLSEPFVPHLFFSKSRSFKSNYYRVLCLGESNGVVAIYVDRVL